MLLAVVLALALVGPAAQTDPAAANGHAAAQQSVSAAPQADLSGSQGNSAAPQPPLVAPQPPLAAPRSANTKAHVEAEPDHARIGEPIVLTIVVEHPERDAVTLPDRSALPRSLAFVKDLGLRRQADPAASGRRITRARWQVMALEGGELALPPLAITVEEGGQKALVEAALPKLVIESALGKDEDAPRPAKGFRATPRVHVLSLRGVISGAILVLLASTVAVVVVVRRARRKTTAAKAPSWTEQLAALEQRARAEPEEARALTYALTHFVRSALDARAGESREALTDADWSHAVASDARIPDAARSAAVRFLAEAERVKYAQESPSLLALRDWLAQARAVVEALGEPARVAA